MEAEDTFVWFLHECGIDTRDAQMRYMRSLKDKPEFIMKFYAREFPEEYIAWKAKRRILG